MDICTDPNFLRVLLYIKIIVEIIKVGACLILIVMGMINCGKAIIANDNDIPKTLKKFKTQLFVAAFIFLIPTIINMLLFTDNIITKNLNSFNDCVNNMSLDKIKEIEKRNQVLTDEIRKKYENAPIDNNLDKWITENGTEIDSTLSSGNITLTKFVSNWEGSTGSSGCKDNEYVAKDLGDGTITAGYGVTNYQIDNAKKLGYGGYFPMQKNDCIPKKAIDSIKTYFLENLASKVKSKCNKYELNCTNDQLIAMTSLGYNSPTRYSEALAAYKSGGKSGFIAYMQSSIDGKSSGLVHRRDGETEMFLDGYTTNVAKYYSKSLKYLH